MCFLFFTYKNVFGVFEAMFWVWVELYQHNFWHYDTTENHFNLIKQNAFKAGHLK